MASDSRVYETCRPHVGSRFTTQALELTVIGSVYKQSQRKRLTGNKQINSKARKDQRKCSWGDSMSTANERREISDEDLLRRVGRGMQGPRTATGFQGPVLPLQAISFLQASVHTPGPAPPQMTPRGQLLSLGQCHCDPS